MIGQGVLRECLLDPDVRLVQTIGRRTKGLPVPSTPKLREIVHPDLWDYSSIQATFSGFDVCLFMSWRVLFRNEVRMLTNGLPMGSPGGSKDPVPA
jgi:hypothetical protein